MSLPPLDDEEARFFTKQLADDRHPDVLCTVCSRKITECMCTGDELRAWLKREDPIVRDVISCFYRCSRQRR